MIGIGPDTSVMVAGLREMTRACAEMAVGTIEKREAEGDAARPWGSESQEADKNHELVFSVT
jgi:hypothetical protein